MKKINKSKQLETLDEWCERFTSELAGEVYYALENNLEFVGEDAYNYMLAQFLTGYVAAITYRALAAMPKDLVDKQAQYKYAEKNFKEMKARVCLAVSSGVTAGVKTWSGKEIDYYCLLKVVPEPVNKEMI